MWTVPAGEPLFRHCAATALLTLPPAALLTRFAAGTAIDTGDTAWLLAASALVLLMAPGLALFYGGMVRSKSVLNMMMMTFGALAAITVIWVLVGYSLAFGDDLGGGLVGDPLQHFGLQSLVAESADSWLSVPIILFAMFQGLFCVITGALVSGAIADRARFGAWVVFVSAWTVLVYAPVAHWVFDLDRDGHAGGWLANRVGTIDFAGGMAVEICSGASALALVMVVGSRVGFGKDAMRPHNLTLVMLGAGLLWFGWYGFNAGSALGADHTAAVVFVTTSCAGAAGAIGWLALERYRDGHATTLGAASGMVAGLVAITPSGGSVTPLGALVMGLTAGVICALAVGLKYRWRYDDSLDVVGVHLVGGLVGTLGVGVLGTASAPTGVDGLLYGGGVDQLGRQLVGAAAVLAYAFLASGAIAWVVHRLMGFRIDEEHEVTGIDLVIHAETAYDLHATAGARTSGAFHAPKATSGPFAPPGPQD
jgi:Amt family ammonium transporter